jgi:abortive infection bacteriophage resistance protein
MFNKPATSIENQIKLLKGRGLIIAPHEEDEIRLWLTNVTYYKLSGYWFIFENKGPESKGQFNQFLPGTSWKKVKYTYIFDQKLRRLVWAAIEKIEISIKAHWAHYLAMTYGPHAHEQKQLFNRKVFFASAGNICTYDKLQNSYRKSNTLYAKHYRTKYPELTTPPIWVVALIISFGEMVNWIKNLKSPKDRNNIFIDYGFDEQIMIPFLTHLNEVRNICAHNGRLWNRKILKTFIPPKKMTSQFSYITVSAEESHTNAKIYNTIIMMNELLKAIDPKYPFLLFVRNLMKDNYLIDPQYMWFPASWEDLHPWCELLH